MLREPGLSCRIKLRQAQHPELPAHPLVKGMGPRCDYPCSKDHGCDRAFNDLGCEPTLALDVIEIRMEKDLHYCSGGESQLRFVAVGAGADEVVGSHRQ